ncbi:MAG TPA: lipoyl(octanoyl) transferase LipB [Candidatus Eisenbacteria bacterium]
MHAEAFANKQVNPHRPARRIWAGHVGYDAGQEIQKRLVGERQAGAVPDTLLLLEHPLTYTIGRSGGDNNLLVPEVEIEKLGGTVHRVDRGGDITFHGPGQLVGYPIVDLNDHYRDVHRYLRDLEEVLIRVLARWKIRADRVAGLSGVWVGQDKVAAMGVHVSRWVTSHGFALNVSTDLAHFGRIIPCGIADRGVTSMERLLKSKLTLMEVAEATAEEFAVVFGVSWEPDKWVPV